jgi:hypothetical protein
VENKETKLFSLQDSHGVRYCNVLVVFQIILLNWAFTALTKKKKKIFLIHREIQSGADAKSYMRKGFLIYEKMGKYFPIYEEAVCHI